MRIAATILIQIVVHILMAISIAVRESRRVEARELPRKCIGDDRRTVQLALGQPKDRASERRETVSTLYAPEVAGVRQDSAARHLS